MSPRISKPTISSPARDFSFAGGIDKNYTGRQLAFTGQANLVRNGAFESWSQGTTGRPDAWGVNAYGVYARESGTVYFGEHCLKITKTSTDGGASQIQQSVRNQVDITQAMGKTFTMSAMLYLKSSTGSGTPGETYLYFYDGTNFKYSRAYDVANWETWQEIYHTFTVPTTATDFRVGIEANEPGIIDMYHYVDCVNLAWGSTAGRFMEHPNDRSVICQDWDDDGTHTEVRGAMRTIPFKVTGTTTGGSASEYITYVLTYGCSQILHVSLNFYSYTGTISRVKLRATNYTTTGFDLYFDGIATNIEVAKDYVIDGCIWCIGWDANGEQWK